MDDRKRNSRRLSGMDEITAQVEILQGMIENQLQRINREREHLERERSGFEKTKQKVAEVHFSHTVKLDVGGHQFKTSLSTLRKEESMLSSMFSGSGFKVEKDEDGFYFIDRPGSPFVHILHYLQTGVFIPPADPMQLKLLKLEADFYQIRSLIDLLTPKIHECKFEHVNDNNGVLHWLGTNRGRTHYTNPVSLGTVRVEGSTNNIAAVQAGFGEAGWCHDARNKYFTIVLPIAVVPSSYSLSHSRQCCRPSNWTLKGSQDGLTWDTLRNHVNDMTLEDQDRFNWKIPNSEKSYRQFRVTCTGYDQGGSCYCFHICGVEVYGDVELCDPS
jgi:hypothetical protein